MQTPKTPFRDPATEEYIRATEFLAKTKSTFVFENSSPIHANIVLATLFKYSEKVVRIYDDILNGDIADKDPIFYLALEDFLASGKKLMIMLRSSEIHSNHFTTRLNLYRSLYPGSIEIRLAEGNIGTATVKGYEKDINFAVGDNVSYRMEVNGKEEGQDRKALCSFNDSLLAGQLLQHFDNYFAVGKILQLPSAVG